jgi:hypothetical protein
MRFELAIKILFREFGWWAGKETAKFNLVKIEGNILNIGINFKIAV